MPALYVVATPIGNLEDMTQRAIRILKEVKLIAAEDTRKTRTLLSAYDIKTPTTSYHEHNKLTKLEYVLSVLEKDDVALVSDAGMPGISDPGYELISAVIKQNKPVIPIPGPSVLISAWLSPDCPPTVFAIWVSYPTRPATVANYCKVKRQKNPRFVFFESPHRLS